MNDFSLRSQVQLLILMKLVCPGDQRQVHFLIINNNKKQQHQRDVSMDVSTPLSLIQLIISILVNLNVKCVSIIQDITQIHMKTWIKQGSGQNLLV